MHLVCTLLMNRPSDSVWLWPETQRYEHRVTMGTNIYRSLHTPEPRNPQKVSKRSSPASPLGVSKKYRKSPKRPENESKRCQNQCSGTFRHFFDTPGGEAREDCFETFLGFRSLRVWRLAVPIVNIWGFPASQFARINSRESPRFALRNAGPSMPQNPRGVSVHASNRCHMATWRSNPETVHFLHISRGLLGCDPPRPLEPPPRTPK